MAVGPCRAVRAAVAIIAARPVSVASSLRAPAVRAVSRAVSRTVGSRYGARRFSPPWMPASRRVRRIRGGECQGIGVESEPGGKALLNSLHNGPSCHQILTLRTVSASQGPSTGTVKPSAATVAPSPTRRGARVVLSTSQSRPVQRAATAASLRPLKERLSSQPPTSSHSPARSQPCTSRAQRQHRAVVATAAVIWPSRYSTIICPTQGAVA